MKSMPVLMIGRLAVALLLAAVFTATSLAAAGDPEKRAIKRADQAWAKRANLTHRDVPSTFLQQGTGTAGKSGGGLTCPNFAPDLSHFTITGQATSPAFARADGTTVFSAVEVFRSAGDERGDWYASARPGALPCVAKMLSDQLQGTVRIVSRSLRQAPRLGQRAISFRVVGIASVSGVTAKLWFDIMGVSRGRADATLAVVSVRRAPSSRLENSLLAKLASRLH
jgi:hypothetical protein